MTSLPLLAFEPKPREFHARLSRRRVRTLGARGRRRRSGRRALILLAAIAVPAFAAPEGWSGFAIGNAGQAQVVLEPMPFEQAGNSFPGSAFYYLAPDAPSPVLDPLAHWDSDEPLGGPVARALRQAGTPLDRTRALQCLTAAIYYEAASEPDAGQAAVAQVVLNRVAHPSYPNTVCGVVYQGSERSTGCQFSFTCDGSLARIPSRFFWQRAENVARAALAGFVYTPVGLATHYHTIAVHPYWAPSLNYLGTIGAHRFYSFRGAAGASGAFRSAYFGGEPIAAPHARSASANMPDPALDPVAVQRAYEEGLRKAQAGAVSPTTSGLVPIQVAPAPAYSAELQARGGETLYRGEKLPEATGIRPEYQNSGKWITRPGS
ncbi:MAG TPA: cell wall hydrolase [Novosphingobium sp.]|nr:cell wall hydrolase [Novosphingobium sp.]